MSAFNLIRTTAPGEELGVASERVRLELPHGLSDAPYGPYIVTEDLATATNVAITLGQPLLLTGEPGCGKTSFAWAVARQLGVASVFEFQTKSTSVARDLFYAFDTLRRFHDASVGSEDARHAEQYVSFQALGEAIRSPQTCVVLIDEIGKAPRDFPNDLLREVDRMEFTVAELSPPAVFRATVRHVLVITSNEERRLPLPFLRRCVYHHIPFPDSTMLARIVQAHLADLKPSASFVTTVVRRFLDLRQVDGISKLPATGELLGWARVLLTMGLGEGDLAAAGVGSLPALQVLVKQREDALVLERHR